MFLGSGPAAFGIPCRDGQAEGVVPHFADPAQRGIEDLAHQGHRILPEHGERRLGIGAAAEGQHGLLLHGLRPQRLVLDVDQQLVQPGRVRSNREACSFHRLRLPANHRT